MYIQGHDGWMCYSQGWGMDHARSPRDKAAELKATLLQHHSREDFGTENPFIFIFLAPRKTWQTGD